MTVITRTRPGRELTKTTGPLEATLVDLIDLNLQAEQARWVFVGPGTKGIHMFLDELVDRYRDWHDEIAERLRTLGLSSDEPVTVLAAVTPFELLPGGPLSDRDVVSFFDGRITRVAKRMSARAQSMGKQDPEGKDLLLEIADGLDKLGWMLRAHPAARRRLSLGRKGRSGQPTPSAA